MKQRRIEHAVISPSTKGQNADGAKSRKALVFRWAAVSTSQLRERRGAFVSQVSDSGFNQVAILLALPVKLISMMIPAEVC